MQATAADNTSNDEVSTSQENRFLLKLLVTVKVEKVLMMKTVRIMHRMAGYL